MKHFSESLEAVPKKSQNGQLSVLCCPREHLFLLTLEELALQIYSMELRDDGDHPHPENEGVLLGTTSTVCLRYQRLEGVCSSAWFSVLTRVRDTSGEASV